MNFFFDYIYYRVTQAYSKSDKEKGITAIMAICIIQLMILLYIYLYIIYPIFILNISPENPTFISSVEDLVFVASFIGLYAYNNKKYSKRYKEFYLFWKNEGKITRIFKGILVVASLLSAILLPIIILFVF